jgi:tRNA dimethylallyltransferase
VALEEMSHASALGQLPILCGGSGMYLAGLVHGLAPIPDPGAAARAEARALLLEVGSVRLHTMLMAHDPTTATLLRPEDSQRVARAWEVWRGTGRGLTAWQSERLPPAPWRFVMLYLDPDRAVLRDAIAARFAQMLAHGALTEVEDLLTLKLDPALPAMRAHGVPELAAHLRGDISLAEAARRATLATGQYTKRQATWFRHHPLTEPGRTNRIYARIPGMQQFSESFMADLVNFIVDTR